MKYLLGLLFALSTIIAYAQPGSVNVGVVRSKVEAIDTTAARVVPTGYSNIFWNRAKGKWQYYQDGVWNYLGTASFPTQSGHAGEYLTTDGTNVSWAPVVAGVSSVSGTANRIESSGGSTPVIDISASYVGQSSITTLGTIGTGIWNGTAITDSYISSASTWNAKQSAITFGTGVQTALGVNIGSAGAPVLFNGAGGTPSSMTGTNITGIPESGVTNLTSDLALKSPLASPAFTGTPTAPTATVGNNTTQLATTAFVIGQALVAASAGVDGYLTGTDWSTFNGKQDNLTINSANSRSISGTWTAPGNNAYHLDLTGTFTARATASDNLIGYKWTPTLIAGAATQNLVANLQTPSFNVNSQTNPKLVGNRYAATVTGSPGSHVAYLIENGAVVIGATSLISGVTGLQVNGTGTSSGVAFIVSSSTPTTRFYVQENGISIHTPTFTTTATGQAGFGTNGAITGRASNADLFTVFNNITSLTIGANSQTGWANSYTGAINDPGFTNTTIGGYLFNPSITNTPDNLYGFVSVPTASLSGFGTATPTATLHTVGTVKIEGTLTLPVAGNGIFIKEGTNATSGVTTLVAGTVTVNTTKVTANSRIHLSIQSLGTVLIPTMVAVTARSAGTSFTITSADITDTSIISWLIIEPAP